MYRKKNPIYFLVIVHFTIFSWSINYYALYLLSYWIIYSSWSPPSLAFDKGNPIYHFYLSSISPITIIYLLLSSNYDVSLYCSYFKYLVIIECLFLFHRVIRWPILFTLYSACFNCIFLGLFLSKAF